MNVNKSIALFWFRRDLRLIDNKGLNTALENHDNVLPIFIFDSNILEELDANDPRVSFIHLCLDSINKNLKRFDSSIKVVYGNPYGVFEDLINEYSITDVYLNSDYEPYERTRDKSIFELLTLNDIKLH